MQNIKGKKVKVRSIAVRKQPHCYGNSRAIWDHTVLPATQQRWHSRLYPSQLKPVLDSATPGGMQGWVDLVGLVTYGGGITARRLTVLTGLNVERFRSCDERYYRYAKPATNFDPSKIPFVHFKLGSRPTLTPKIGHCTYIHTFPSALYLIFPFHLKCCFACGTRSHLSHTVCSALHTDGVNVPLL